MKGFVARLPSNGRTVRKIANGISECNRPVPWVSNGLIPGKTFKLYETRIVAR